MSTVEYISREDFMDLDLQEVADLECQACKVTLKSGQVFYVDTSEWAHVYIEKDISNGSKT